MKTYTELAAEYAAYHTMKEFQLGIEAYAKGDFVNNPFDGVAAQAYDRGAEAAMKWRRLHPEQAPGPIPKTS